MDEQIEKFDQEEEEQLTCPECGKGFQDMRGLTSHARNKHNLNKDEIHNALISDNAQDSRVWRIVAGFGAFFLAIIFAGRK